MAGIDRWKISPETRAKFVAILDEAPKLGIDRDQAVAAGLPGLRALIGLKKAADAGRRKTRDLALAETRDALRAVARRNPKLANQFEARILALQGRGSDTEVVHIARGELVVPQALQNPEVVAALRRAAAAHGVPVEMLLVGNVQNRINPETGAAEFGVMDWISGLFNKDHASDNDYGGEIAPAGTEGAVSRAAWLNLKSAKERADYADKVHALGPNDNAVRAGIKAETRERTPIEFREAIQSERPYLGAREGSIGGANRTNPEFDGIGRTAGRIGRGLAGVGTVLAAKDILTSEEPLRATVANVGSALGGVLGGAAGGAAGTLGGPAAPVTVPASAIAGSVIGGNLGYQGGEAIYDALWDAFHKRRP